jgi:hypothetical protein
VKKPSTRRPRAAGGGDPLITVRLPSPLLALVKAWAKARGINRSAAVRSLLELGLRVQGEKAPGGAQSKTRRAA